MRRENKSYVFFRETELTERGRASRRSRHRAHGSAVDRDRHEHPRLRHAVLPRRGAADRVGKAGDAIPSPDDRAGYRRRSSVRRAPTFISALAAKPNARRAASHNGQFVMLIPNEFDPDDEALGTRLPQPRPKEGVLSNMMSLFSKPKPEKDAEPAAEEAKPNAAGAPAAVLPAAVVPLPKQKPAAKSEAAVKPEAVKPQPVASKPEAAKPQPVAAKPEAARPQPAAARPDAAAKPPVVAKPETAGKPQTAARSDTRPEAAPKPKPAPKPEIAAKPDPAAKPQANPGARPDGRSKPNTAAKNGNPFPKPAGVAPPHPPPPAPPPRTPSDVR